MKKCLWAVLTLLVLSAVCSGCGKKTVSDEDYETLIQKNAETNRSTVLLTISGPDGELSVTRDRALYYLAYYERKGLSYKEEQDAYFKSLYGDEYDFWSLTGSDGDTMQNSYKNAVFSSVVYTEIMYHEAEKEGVTVSDSQSEKLDSLTENFLNNYTLEERARCGMDYDTIRACYERMFTVSLYENRITAGTVVSEEELSELVNSEDYRVYETDYLFVASKSYDENFKEVAFSEEEYAAREAAILDVYEKAGEGENMQELQKQYSDIMTYATRDFYRTETGIEQDYIDTAMGMEDGEVVMLTVSGGWYVIKLIDSTQIVGYDDAKEAAEETVLNTTVSAFYEELEKEYTVTKLDAFNDLVMGKVYSK